MKQQSPVEPPRGKAAFRARKAEVPKRNELARAHGAAQRAAREAGIAARELAADRLERFTYPREPRP